MAHFKSPKPQQKSRQKIWFLIPLIVFAVFIVMLYFRLGKDTKVITNTSLNRPVPAFNLPLLNNPNQLASVADLPKKPYLLNVWASWCITCKIEHPFLLQMAKQGIPIVGINYKDELPDALGYLNSHEDPFTLNVQDIKGSLGIDLGLAAVPESFVVDGKGSIRQHIVGEINQERFDKQVSPCLTALNNNADENKVKEVCQ